MFKYSTKLSEVAEVSFGTYAKTVSEAKRQSSDVLYLQLSDFDAEGALIPDNTWSYVGEGDASEKSVLEIDDILLPAKGSRNTAILYRSHFSKAVASSLFFVIRMTSERALPEFLTIYLNHPNTQSRIKALVSSSVTVPTINKGDFVELPIPIIPLEKQKKLICLHQMQREERLLNQQIIEKNNQLFNGIFIQTIQ